MTSAAARRGVRVTSASVWRMNVALLSTPVSPSVEARHRATSSARRSPLASATSSAIESSRPQVFHAVATLGSASPSLGKAEPKPLIQPVSSTDTAPIAMPTRSPRHQEAKQAIIR